MCAQNFAYVDFGTPQALVKAVALSGQCLPGSDTPLEIAKSAPPGRGTSTGRGGFGRGAPRGGGRGRGGGGGRGGGRGFHGEEGSGGDAPVLGTSMGGHRPTSGLGYAARKSAHPRQHLQVDSGPAGALTSTHFRIRTHIHIHTYVSASKGRIVTHAHVAHLFLCAGGGGHQQAPADAAPKSNADFRAMLLAKRG